MNVSARTEYACIAVLELASGYGTGEPMQIRRIAAAHSIPSRFLVQILLQLRNAGIVTSTRGAAGGYQLAHDPADITIWDVMRAVDGRECRAAVGGVERGPASETLRATWKLAADRQREVLQSVTFAELAERARGNPADMYYI